VSAPQPHGTLLAFSPRARDDLDPRALAARLSALEHVTIRLVHEVRRLETAAARPAAQAEVPLTPRQREVLALVADGLGTAAIAKRLWLSPHTVRNHVDAILRTLDVHSRLEAVAYAHRTGLLDDSSGD
jgi:DNA-binding NarL/FixJ family response regulator